MRRKGPTTALPVTPQTLAFYVMNLTQLSCRALASQKCKCIRLSESAWLDLFWMMVVAISTALQEDHNPSTCLVPYSYYPEVVPSTQWWWSEESSAIPFGKYCAQCPFQRMSALSTLSTVNGCSNRSSQTHHTSLKCQPAAYSYSRCPTLIFRYRHTTTAGQMPLSQAAPTTAYRLPPHALNWLRAIQS